MSKSENTPNTTVYIEHDDKKDRALIILPNNPDPFYIVDIPEEAQSLSKIPTKDVTRVEFLPNGEKFIFYHPNLLTYPGDEEWKRINQTAGDLLSDINKAVIRYAFLPKGHLSSHITQIDAITYSYQHELYEQLLKSFNRSEKVRKLLQTASLASVEIYPVYIATRIFALNGLPAPLEFYASTLLLPPSLYLAVKFDKLAKMIEPAPKLKSAKQMDQEINSLGRK